jgi:M6 family metalloprotease-like protein
MLSSLLIGAYLRFEPMELNQPDGKQLNIFASGDEYHNWLHDKEGYTIRQNNKGWYVYLDKNDKDELIFTELIAGVANPAQHNLDPWLNIPEAEYKEIRARAEQNLIDIGSGRAPSTGTINNLVVFIRFSDQAEFTQTISTYNAMFNGTTGSTMQNYFLEASYNQLNINTTFYPTQATTVVSWQDTAHPRSYFMPYDASTNPGGYNGDTERRTREHTLLVDAVNGISALVPTSLNIDGDNDGKVDNVCFIIQGATTAWATLLWPHRWSLYTYNVYINGKKVYDYNFQLSNSLASSGVGVLCHEMFHSLGAPDLYHYTSNGITPVGSWDIMQTDLNPPQHMSAYMKYKYGHWISSIPVLSTGGTYSLNALTSSTNQCYRINSPNSATEYFIVEFRKKTGTFENSLPGSGMIIYRINPAYNGNASGPPDEVYAFRVGGTPTANGTINSANFSTEVGRTSFNDTTNPYGFLTNGTTLGGISLSGIGSSAGSAITFTYNLSNNPQELTAESYNSKVMLTWRTTVNGTPSGYNVYRNGVFIASTTELNYTDTSVTAGVSYSYYVTATFNNPVSETGPSNIVNIVASSIPLIFIGNETLTNQSLPIEPYYGYTYSQSIFLQSELNLSVNTITKVAWKYNGNSAWTDAIKIYMGHTNLSSFATTTSWIPLANLSLVYQGNIAVSTTPGWVELTLNTPFAYNNTQNLVIAVDENTNGYHASSDEFYCSAVTGNRSIYYYSDSTDPNPSSPPTGTLKAAIPNTKLTVILNPIINVTPTSLSFGNVYIGNTLSRSFSISNTGGSTLSGSITTPAGFVVSAQARETEVESIVKVPSRNVLSFSISAGQSQNYNLVFTPTLAQSYNSNLVFQSNDPLNPTINVALSASGLTPVFNPPTALNSIPSHAQIALAWTVPTGSTATIVGYKVYRNGILITQTPIVATSFVDTGLENGVSYEHAVKAVFSNPAGESVSCSPVTSTPTALPPQNLMGNPDNQIVVLTWQAPQYGTPSQYRIYRNNVLLDISSVNSYTDIAVLNGISYDYYVTAYYGNPTAESVASNTVSAIPFLNLSVTIGQGTLTNLGMPIEPNQFYSYTQSIYLQSEINRSNVSIKKLFWHFNGNSAFTDAIKIYMGHTDLSAFPANSNWVPTSSMTLVYEGNITTTTTAGWIEIPLTTEFAYNNIQNLVIAVDENTSGKHNNSDEFYCSETTTNRSITFSTNGSNVNPDAPPTSGTALLLRQAVPNLKLTMIEVLIPEISVTPDDCETSICYGNTATSLITISNNGTAPLSYSISVSEPESESRGVERDLNWLSLCTYSGTLEVGQSRVVTASMCGYTASPGLHQAIISICSNDPECPNINIPVEFSVRLQTPLSQISTDIGGVEISWSAVPGANSYKVFKSETYDGTFNYITQVNQLSYLDSDCMGCAFYKIVAVFE